ncbi:MAG: hypothetical protein WBQ44_02015 [Rhodococcus sp. (in: high G+C Gram-positive bacteria)]
MTDIGKSLERFRARLNASVRGRLLLRVVSEVGEIGVVDSAMTLAAQSFTSLVPVMIAIGTLGAMDPVSETLRSDYGLDLSGLDSVPDSSAAAFGVAGVLMLIAAATSYARALGRLYARIWSLPIVSFRQSWRWIAVIIVLACGAVSIGAARALDSGPVAEPILVGGAQFAVWLLVWTAVPALLVPRGIPVRARWTTGASTAVGLTGLQAGSIVVLPQVLNNAEQQFGFLGIVFTLIGWLFVYSAIVVVAATAIHALTQDDHKGGPGTWLRKAER